MNEQFVPYEIALKLKEKGFDEECLAYWVDKDTLRGCGAILFEVDGFFKNSLSPEKYLIATPLWQQVIDWLESKHGVAINVTTFMNAEDGKPHIKMFYVHKHPLVVQPKTFECGVSDTLKTKCDVIEYALTLI